MAYVYYMMQYLSAGKGWVDKDAVIEVIYSREAGNISKRSIAKYISQVVSSPVGLACWSGLVKGRISLTSWKNIKYRDKDNAHNDIYYFNGKYARIFCIKAEALESFKSFRFHIISACFRYKQFNNRIAHKKNIKIAKDRKKRSLRKKSEKILFREQGGRHFATGLSDMKYKLRLKQILKFLGNNNQTYLVNGANSNEPSQRGGSNDIWRALSRGLCINMTNRYKDLDSDKLGVSFRQMENELNISSSTLHRYLHGSGVVREEIFFSLHQKYTIDAEMLKRFVFLNPDVKYKFNKETNKLDFIRTLPTVYTDKEDDLVIIKFKSRKSGWDGAQVRSVRHKRVSAGKTRNSSTSNKLKSFDSTLISNKKVKKLFGRSVKVKTTKVANFETVTKSHRKSLRNNSVVTDILLNDLENTEATYPYPLFTDSVSDCILINEGVSLGRLTPIVPKLYITVDAILHSHI
jgi:transcriptional regulator with XRE-family HTH domain